MANYTVTLQNLIASNINLGLNDYPIFNPSYRETLNQKIKDHYFTREIGAETPSLFVWWLNVKMREIMPLYNQYYASALLVFDPLANTKMTETSKKESAGTSNAVGSSTSENANSGTTKSKAVHSDTPSGLLSIGNIDGNVYASDVNMDNAEATNTGDSLTTANSANCVNAVDDFIKTTEGRNGQHTPSEMIKEFRTTFLNIDLLIINELENLFMLVW